MIGMVFIILGITSSWNFMIYIIIGLLCTGIARALFIEKYYGGLFTTSIIGILGAFIGAYSLLLFGINDYLFMSPLHCMLSFIISLLLLYIWYRALLRKK